MDNSKISSERKQLIVKSNEVIQKSRYKLSAQQQKLVLYMISKIRPTDTEFKEYVFDLKNLCQILNIDTTGGNYFRFRESIQKIADCSFWINTDGKDKLYRWFDDVEIEPQTTIIKIKFDEDLKPFLLQLSQDYTLFNLEKVLCFESKYSFRLYEILKSYAYRENIIISLEELKNKMMIADKYDRFTTFKTNVLNKAIEEINIYTDLYVSYSLIREVRTIKSINFTIRESPKHYIDNTENRNKKLNKGAVK